MTWSLKSKLDLAADLIKAFPANPDELVYVLFDSWYTTRKVVDICNQKGFHVISAVKSNRIIYPKGVRIGISEFASRYLENADLRSVTVRGKGKYRIYEYEGPLSEIENVKLLLSWENKFIREKAPFSILCTDVTLDVVTILKYYQVRLEIETGYRYFKELLGFDQYQVLSFKAIERYWAIQYLTQNFLEIQRYEWSTDSFHTLWDTVRRIRNDYFGQLVLYVYQEGLAQTPFKKLLKTLKLAA
ncbi:transposase [Neobacillus terrae]|uniref:transposase n=1 Tax=Neobacillus terrae TaxID=3034837 RepID=UPI00140B4A50|nr:transposase [Neobacillus terrae]NHM33288.1 transposase [Neobacillus terrae]